MTKRSKDILKILVQRALNDPTEFNHTHVHQSPPQPDQRGHNAPLPPPPRRTLTPNDTNFPLPTEAELRTAMSELDNASHCPNT